MLERARAFQAAVCHRVTLLFNVYGLTHNDTASIAGVLAIAANVRVKPRTFASGVQLLLAMEGCEYSKYETIFEHVQTQTGDSLCSQQHRLELRLARANMPALGTGRDRSVKQPTF